VSGTGCVHHQMPTTEFEPSQAGGHLRAAHSVQVGYPPMAEVINQFWVGIDVAKAKFDAAVFPDGMQPERWRQLETKSFASDKKGVAAFVRWIQTLGGCCAGMCAESTGIYSADLAEALHEKAPDLPLLAIVNPARVKATAKTFGTKDKSDSVDARVIAAFAAWHRPKPTPLRSPEWQNPPFPVPRPRELAGRRGRVRTARPGLSRQGLHREPPANRKEALCGGRVLRQEDRGSHRKRAHICKA
jgi:transposase